MQSQAICVNTVGCVCALKLRATRGLFPSSPAAPRPPGCLSHSLASPPIHQTRSPYPTDVTEPTPVPSSAHAPCTPHFPAPKTNTMPFPIQPPPDHILVYPANPARCLGILARYLILPILPILPILLPLSPPHPPLFYFHLPRSSLSCTSHPNLAFGYSFLKHPLPHICIISPMPSITLPHALSIATS
jgi:hypothetical protein